MLKNRQKLEAKKEDWMMPYKMNKELIHALNSQVFDECTSKHTESMPAHYFGFDPAVRPVSFTLFGSNMITKFRSLNLK